MATYFGNIDLANLEIGPVETGNNGRKYKKISYNGNQLKDIQLGENIRDLLRCPFGVEPVAQDQPNKLCIKVDVTEKLASFIKSIDNKVIEAVNDESLTHRSTLRTSVNDNLKIKIQTDTQVLVTTLKDKEKNIITAPVVGTHDDLKPGCMLLPIIKIQGGVYFIESNYGTSIVASQILIVHGTGDNAEIAFNLGDHIMVDD